MPGEVHNVGYIVGLAKNARLNALTATLQAEAADCFAATGHKVRWFSDRYYAAATWHREHRVIAKLEHSGKGGNPRYVMTNLDGASSTAPGLVESDRLLERILA